MSHAGYVADNLNVTFLRSMQKNRIGRAVAASFIQQESPIAIWLGRMHKTWCGWGRAVRPGARQVRRERGIGWGAEFAPGVNDSIYIY